MEFNQEELKNLALLLQRVDIKGNEALPVVLLQQKIAKLLTPEESKKDDKGEPKP